MFGPRPYILTLALLLAPAPACAQIFAPEAFHGVAEVRVGGATGEPGWIDGGQGKTGLHDTVKLDMPQKANVDGLLKGSLIITLDEDWPVYGLKAGSLISVAPEELAPVGPKDAVVGISASGSTPPPRSSTTTRPTRWVGLRRSRRVRCTARR